MKPKFDPIPREEINSIINVKLGAIIEQKKNLDQEINDFNEKVTATP